MSRASILFKCGNAEHSLLLSLRDVQLLDGRHFFEDGWHYRELLDLDFVKGLARPKVGATLVTHKRHRLIISLQSLLHQLESQADLLSFSYSYEFTSDKDRRHVGGQSGIRIRGLSGFIDVRPSGYCTLTLSEIAPNGKGRVVEIIDMRVRKQIETDEMGILRVHRRKEQVGWLAELPKLMHFLERARSDDVEVLLSG
jgi:hypothetical protein